VFIEEIDLTAGIGKDELASGAVAKQPAFIQHRRRRVQK
jgi:hypothetical protein